MRSLLQVSQDCCFPGANLEKCRQIPFTSTLDVITADDFDSLGDCGNLFKSKLLPAVEVVDLKQTHLGDIPQIYVKVIDLLGGGW